MAQNFRRSQFFSEWEPRGADLGEFWPLSLLAGFVTVISPAPGAFRGVGLSHCMDFAVPLWSLESAAGGKVVLPF